MSNPQSGSKDRPSKTSLLTPVYESMSVVPLGENFAEIKDIETIEDPGERLKKFESVIEMANIAINQAAGHSIAAGLALIKIEAEGLHKTRLIDDGGVKRPMTMTEFYIFASRLGLGTSPKTLGRCKDAARIWLYLKKSGFSVQLNRAPLLAFRDVDLEQVPALWAKLIETSGNNPTEREAEAIVSEFHGEVRVPKESSFGKLKRCVRELIKKGEDHLSAGNLDEVKTVFAEMRSHVDPGSSRKSKGSPNVRRSGKAKGRRKPDKRDNSSPASENGPEPYAGINNGPGPEDPPDRQIGPTLLMLRGTEILVRHHPFNPRNPPLSDGVIRGAGFEYSNGYLRLHCSVAPETARLLFDDLCGRVKAVMEETIG